MNINSWLCSLAKLDPWNIVILEARLRILFDFLAVKCYASLGGVKSGAIRHHWALGGCNLGDDFDVEFLSAEGRNAVLGLGNQSDLDWWRPTGGITKHWHRRVWSLCLGSLAKSCQAAVSVREFCHLLGEDAAGGQLWDCNCCVHTSKKKIAKMVNFYFIYFKL
jgi:hypothetical protein